MRKNPFHLEVVSVRLVKDAPIMSEHPITSPETAVSTLGKYMSEFDREIVCVVNLKNDGTPINCSFVSTGCLSEAMAHTLYQFLHEFSVDVGIVEEEELPEFDLKF